MCHRPSLGRELEAHRLEAGQVVRGQVRLVDKALSLFIGQEGGEFLNQVPLMATDLLASL